MTTDRLSGLVGSAPMKLACRVATTAAITLEGLQTIDGVAVAADDRVLVKDQASSIANGIYLADTGEWTRAPDFDGSRDIVDGTLVRVNEGTLAGKLYAVSTSSYYPVIGTDAIAFVTSGIDDAANITFTPGGGVAATDVQGAILEVAGDVTSLASDLSTAEGDIDDLETAVAAAAVVDIRPPSGRLTLTTATPVMTSEALAATVVYYTPYLGNTVPIYNGTNFANRTFAELSAGLDSDSGHTGYHQSGKNFDWFVFDDNGTLRLGSGPAWSSDTARGTGAGTTELERYLGFLVNKVSIVLRFGSASGNTVTVDARKATYLGTSRMTANGQTQFSFGAIAANGTEAKLFLWNMYNRVEVGAVVGDTTDSWGYTTTTVRSANASDTMRVSLVVGINEDIAVATYQGVASTSNSRGTVGVGLDSTSAFSGAPAQFAIEAVAVSAVGRLVSRPGIGLHFFQALELGATGVTFYGDNGAATTFQNMLSVHYRM